MFNGWQLLAQQDSEPNNPNHFQTHYALSEPNGKLQGLFTPAGELAWQAEPKSLWGLYLKVVHHRRNLSPIDPQMLFSGQWLDNESGLAYNRFRYYDPETASYLTLDPIGLQGGETPYRYVGNPLDWVDWLGLSSCLLAKNMEQAGVPRPANSAAHHIVPITDRFAHEARNILAKHNIDINSAHNGVFLPNRMNTDGLPGILHNGRHPEDYSRRINELLSEADQSGGKTKVLETLNKIRTTLTNAPRAANWRTVLK